MVWFGLFCFVLVLFFLFVLFTRLHACVLLGVSFVSFSFFEFCCCCRFVLFFVFGCGGGGDGREGGGGGSFFPLFMSVYVSLLGDGGEGGGDAGGRLNKKLSFFFGLSLFVSSFVFSFFVPSPVLLFVSVTYLS